MLGLRTAEQNSAIHRLLGTLGWANAASKGALALQYSNNRTAKTSELTPAEAQALIDYLTKEAANVRNEREADFKAGDKMRKKILAMAKNLGWGWMYNGRWCWDFKAIDAWCKKFSKANADLPEASPKRKGLNGHTAAEMPTLVSQFERMEASEMKRRANAAQPQPGTETQPFTPNIN